LQQRGGIGQCAGGFAAAVPAEQDAVADDREFAAGRHHQDGTPGGQQGLFDEFVFVGGLDIVAVLLADNDEVAGPAVQGDGSAGRGFTGADDGRYVCDGGGFQKGVLYLAAVLGLQVLHDVERARHHDGFAVVVLWRRGAGVDPHQFGLVALGQFQRQPGAALAVKPVVQVDGNAAVHGGPPWLNKPCPYGCRLTRALH